ncbi:MipA/OmpV family protein [Sphingomonas hengshuiensis]|uniref:Structural protein MipA n=1 Tax=Sphingomonas hengshuiensis TaxID=1609977 RepID=A0A7U4LGT6_9SPHN|nr:MipA/OmpV family protein [Sphingomonas hengshuiensis]AJP73663.1 structural protein MipA [Sphingomonas hengshuiensis]
MALRPVLLIAALAAASPAFAQETPPPADTGGDFAIVGAGAAILPDYEGSNDYRFTPVPAAAGRLGGFNFQLVGNRLSVDLLDDGPGPGWDIQAGPVGVLNLNRTSIKAIEDTRIKALGKISTAVEAGAYFGIGRVGVITSDYDRLSVTATYRHDVGSVHGAGVFTPSITYMTPLSRKAMVGIFGSADRVEHGYASTYFGVTPQGSAASGLAVYDPRGGWKSWTAGVGGAVSLTGDLTGGLQLVAGGTYSRMLGDFADSPIVSVAGAKGQWIGAAGFAFSF